MRPTTRARRDHLADRSSEHRARPAEGDVADELLPDEPVDVVVGADGEAGVRHTFATASILGVTAPGARRAGRAPSRSGGRGPASTTEAPKPPTTPTATRSSPSTAAAASGPPRPFWIESTSVSGPTSGRATFGRGRRVHRLRRQYDELGLARLGRVRGGIDPDGPVAACPLDTEPVRADRLDQVLAAVDRPDLVAGTRQEPGVHRSHRAGADDRDLHPADSRTGPAGRAPGRGRAARPRAAARPAVR